MAASFRGWVSAIQRTFTRGYSHNHVRTRLNRGASGIRIWRDHHVPRTATGHFHPGIFNSHERWRRRSAVHSARSTYYATMRSVKAKRQDRKNNAAAFRRYKAQMKERIANARTEVRN